MTDDIDPSRLRITEAGRKLLDTGIKDCYFCGRQPIVKVLNGTGRCRVMCNARSSRDVSCTRMHVNAWNMRWAIRKWNRLMDKEDREMKELRRYQERNRWIRVK